MAVRARKAKPVYVNIVLPEQTGRINTDIVTRTTMCLVVGCPNGIVGPISSGEFTMAISIAAGLSSPIPNGTAAGYASPDNLGN